MGGTLKKKGLLLFNHNTNISMMGRGKKVNRTEMQRIFWLVCFLKRRFHASVAKATKLGTHVAVLKLGGYFIGANWYELSWRSTYELLLCGAILSNQSLKNILHISLQDSRPKSHDNRIIMVFNSFFTGSFHGNLLLSIFLNAGSKIFLIRAWMGKN